MAPKSKSKKSENKANFVEKKNEESNSDLKQPYDPDKTSMQWDVLPPDLRPGYDLQKAYAISSFLEKHRDLINAADINGHNRDKAIRRLVGVAEELYSLNVKMNDLPLPIKKKFANPTVVAGSVVNNDDDIRAILARGGEMALPPKDASYAGAAGLPAFADTASAAAGIVEMNKRSGEYYVKQAEEKKKVKGGL